MMQNSYETMEKWYPSLFGVVAALISWTVYDATMSSAVKELISTTISIAAIAVGFLGTTNSILISIDTRDVIQRLKQMGSYSLLVDYLISATQCSLGLAVLIQPAAWHPYAFAAWVFLVATALAQCHRVIRLFGRILRSLCLPV